MARRKYITEKATVADAVSAAYGLLQELRDEVREVVENASEGLRQTGRIQTLESTADALDGFCDDEPSLGDTVDDWCATTEVSYSVETSRRGLSRRARCSNAVAMLQAVVDAMQNHEDPEDAAEPSDLHGDLADIAGDIENAISEAENCEFPGMYG